MKITNKTKIILASGSPRRKELMERLGFEIEVEKIDVDESYPRSLAGIDVAQYIATKKSDAYLKEYDPANNIVITADTVVINEGKVLGKPMDLKEAFEFLSKLSNSIHKVITGVCMNYKDKRLCFSDVSEVSFEKMSKEEIEYYIRNYKVLDKAGAYAIQEWIGLSKISKIEGSYTNIMGLPTQKLYQKMKEIGIEINYI